MITIEAMPAKAAVAEVEAYSISNWYRKSQVCYVYMSDLTGEASLPELWKPDRNFDGTKGPQEVAKEVGVLGSRLEGNRHQDDHKSAISENTGISSIR